MIFLVACVEPADVAPDAPSSKTGTPTSSPAPVDPDSLSALGLVSWDGEALAYAEGVVEYTLGTPLFSDHALKDRAIALPAGEVATYSESGPLGFPVGTRILKTFSFPVDFRDPTAGVRLVETRVLTLEEDGWDAWPYLWNDEQTEAFREPSGAVLDLSFVDEDGQTVAWSYLVPQRNQCIDCHEKTDEEGERVQTLIGPSARNLHHGGQLASFAGWIDGLPELGSIVGATDATLLEDVDPATLDDETLTAAARDYLDVNCAHCHSPSAEEGRSSQLFLNWDNEDAFNYGVCKRPGSAGQGAGGLEFDIVPGDPESSILWYRMQSTTVGEMMPDLGRSLQDGPGVALIAEWIRRLEGACSE